MNTTLFIILLFCHWAADYTHLSMPFMLQAKRTGKPLGPIFLHAAVHGLLMLYAYAIYDLFTPAATNLLDSVHSLYVMSMIFPIQTFSHFAIDVWKGRMNVWFPSLTNPANVFHWWVFGLDQMLHILILVLLASL